MRLIDADAIYSEMKDYYFTHRDEHDASWEGGFGKCMNMIPKAPTSDLQPRKGKWIKGDDCVSEYRYFCNQCKAHHRARYDYCPSCGSKMD